MSTTPGDESEMELVARAVHELVRRTGFPVAFGGLLSDGHGGGGGEVSVTSIVGNRTRRLDGLRVRPERGLGGRAMTEQRPRMTSDYGSSRQITHDYDGFVLGEGLRTLLALPIIVDGRARGVLYAGAWESAPAGGVSTAPAMQVAQSVAEELRIRDEVQRRLGATPAGGTGIPAAHREELREAFVELRGIAASIEDPALRARIGTLERRLVSLAGGTGAPSTPSVSPIRLSRRETDVLARVALGETNAQVAARLQLTEGTIKAYLAAAMAKLDASTRHSAVAKARRAGLLP
ncbi:LuxR C-terminal-related transcriptional regulator [Microbacterium sp. ZW T5_45]|uniref:LuxR C-terminal-related transcriptional regulator n=1 Tax=Microbacterium sp. ZW T5_45 TaxID=3378080 RepID=UPI0038525209